MSYIGQSWDPPMYAQDEAVDLLVAEAREDNNVAARFELSISLDANPASQLVENQSLMCFGHTQLPW